MVAVFGRAKSEWRPLAEGVPSLRLFETELEATQWIEQTIKEKETKKTAEPPADPEAEIKQKNLAALLAKYSIYQMEADYDPNLLRKHGDEYKVKPQREPLFALRKANKGLEQVESQLLELDQRCEKLAHQLAYSTHIRKTPISGPELASKKNSVDALRLAIESEIKALTDQIETQKKAAAEWKAKSLEVQQRYKGELASFEKLVQDHTEENKKLSAALQSQKK